MKKTVSNNGADKVYISSWQFCELIHFIMLTFTARKKFKCDKGKGVIFNYSYIENNVS
jgi:hypothetical protein